jgi:lipid A 3-O-deacylase
VPKIIFLIFISCFILIYLPENSYGYDSAELRIVDSTLEIEWEYLTPVEKARQINTLTLDILRESSHGNYFSYYQGLTITRAWGNLEHMGMIKDTSAFGIGPVYLMKYEPFKWPHAALSFDLSGGLILYNQDFPTGGDFYNFMWRIGPKFSYKINDNFRFDIGYKLMHVSNGQWSNSPANSHNPAYNADGISLSFTNLF